jgi:hypothetical protein
MLNLARREWFRPLALALLMIGIGLTVFGVISFINTQSQIEQNFAHRVQTEQITLEALTEAEGMMLMSADIQLGQLQNDLNRAVIMSGVGIICLAVGWMGRLLAGEASLRYIKTT